MVKYDRSSNFRYSCLQVIISGIPNRLPREVNPEVYSERQAKGETYARHAMFSRPS